MEIQVPLTSSQHQHVLSQAAQRGTAPEIYIGQLIERDQTGWLHAQEELLPLYLDACVKQFEQYGPSHRSVDDIWREVKQRFVSQGDKNNH